MSEKKKFLLRIDEHVFASLEKWAADDLRSVNSQIEFLLTDALKRAKRPPGTLPPNRPSTSQVKDEQMGTTHLTGDDHSLRKAPRSRMKAYPIDA
jgi:hypothetical protein